MQTMSLAASSLHTSLGTILQHASCCVAVRVDLKSKADLDLKLLPSCRRLACSSALLLPLVISEKRTLLSALSSKSRPLQTTILGDCFAGALDHGAGSCKTSLALFALALTCVTSLDNWPRPFRDSKSFESLAHGRVCEGGFLHRQAGSGRRGF